MKRSTPTRLALLALLAIFGCDSGTPAPQATPAPAPGSAAEKLPSPDVPKDKKAKNAEGAPVNALK